MKLTNLVACLDKLLEPWRFKDYAPNGLQVEGKAEVGHLVTGVTASQELIDQAVELGADAILVHHGYFWKGEEPCIIGMKQKRISTLLRHNISLIAYHLPLDAHPVLGNNVMLAHELGLSVNGCTAEHSLLWYGDLPVLMPAIEWVGQVDAILGRRSLLLGDGNKLIRRIAWCTGGAQGYFGEALRLGVDAFLTGEVSEQNYHMALESNTVFVAAGHHATERYGIKAVGQFVADKNSIKVTFIDSMNPV